MGFEIQDGTGTGNRARVDGAKRLLVDANVNTTPHFLSIFQNQFFNVTSEIASASASDIFFYIANNSLPNELFINKLYISSENACNIRLLVVSGVPTGTPLVQTNLFLPSGNAPTTTAFGDAAVTGLTVEKRLPSFRLPDSGSILLTFEDGLILGTNDAIALEYVSGSAGGAEANLLYYLKDVTSI